MKDFIDIIKDKVINNIYENFNRYFDTILKGIKYILCVSFIVAIARLLVRYPLKLAYEYGIDIEGKEYVEIYKYYGYTVLGILIISILAIPAVKLANRLKNISKEGIELDKELQNGGSEPIKTEVQGDSVEDIINSNDERDLDEESEKNIYNRRIESSEEFNNYLKCKNIKNNMKPMTVLITNELYNNNKDCITKDIVFEYICNVKNRKGKKLEEQNRQIAKNIVDFLKKNDIIESDDMKDEYYFTPFGNIFMNYFRNGII